MGAGAMVRAVTLSAGTQIAAKAVHLGLNVVASLALIRYFGPASYGDYVFVFSFATLLGLVSDMGIAKVAVRGMARDERQTPGLLGTTVVARLCLAAFAAVGAQLVLVAMGARPEIHAAVAIASLLFFTDALLSVAALFQVRIALQYDALVQIVIQTLDTLLILILIARSASLVAIVAAPVISAVVGVAVAIVLARARFDLRVSFDARRLAELLREAAPVGANLFVAVVYLKIDTILVSVMRGPEEVGYYGAAYKPIEYLLLASAVLVNTLFPLLARWHRADHGRFVTIYRRGTEILLVGAIPIAIILSFAAEPLVTAVYSEAFAPAAAALKILSVALVFMTFNAWQGFVLLAGGRQRVTLAYDAVALVLNVVLNLLLIRVIGFVGAAFAALLTGAFIGIVGTVAVSRLLSSTLDIARIRSVLLANALLAVSLAGLLLSGMHWLGAIALASLAYPVWLFLFSVVTTADLRLLRSDAPETLPAAGR